MKVILAHGTTRSRALEELKVGGSKLMARFGSEISELQQKWQENGLTFSFRARGFTVSGVLIVGEEQVELEATLPLVARLLVSEGEIRERVLQAMQEVFASEADCKERRA
ncbi:MAG: polyhydroxyalkanoic acid system family protein [Chloroflexi bacterium]|nr:polyhydroxyalkanoic acid system family protein [Chloroflexota bacterium]